MPTVKGGGGGLGKYRHVEGDLPIAPYVMMSSSSSGAPAPPPAIEEPAVGGASSSSSGHPAPAPVEHPDPALGEWWLVRTGKAFTCKSCNAEIPKFDFHIVFEPARAPDLLSVRWPYHIEFNCLPRFGEPGIKEVLNRDSIIFSQVLFYLTNSK